MLVIGLGNPGRRFENTRHNAGFWTIDLLSRAASIPLHRKLFRPYSLGMGRKAIPPLYLVKPLTFMNRSGEVFPRLLLIYDNLDLPPGTCRMKVKGSGGGQKGMASIIDALGTDRFVRIAIGIGRPEGPDTDAVRYVLGHPGTDDKARIMEACARAAQGVLRIPEVGMDRVINEINARV